MEQGSTPRTTSTTSSAVRYLELFSLLSYAFAAFLIFPWIDQRMYGWCGTGALMQANMSMCFGGICALLAFLSLIAVRDPAPRVRIVARFVVSGIVAFLFPMAVMGIGEMLV